MSTQRRIVVAMSGGVDSSAAAALLRDSDAEVIGVTLKLYNAAGTAASVGGRCCSPRDIADARAVCAHLGIPHYVLDEVEHFTGAVIDDFVAEYRAGRTPNPCVRCNERIKFGPLLNFAKAMGAEALATGHYARLEPGPDGPRLFRAVDRDKDQSYFLFGVRPEIWRAIRFPLGNLHKSEVRELARRAGLANCDKPDSNEICFIPEGDHGKFLTKRGGAGVAGEIFDENGRSLGQHDGTHNFTVGQRKGIPGHDGKRRFVLRVEPMSGAVFTGPREALAREELLVQDVRWLSEPLDPARPCEVQIRHRGEAHPARVVVSERDNKTVRVVFEQAVEGGAPGQAAVFYVGNQLVGGGFIASDEPARVPRAGIASESLRA